MKPGQDGRRVARAEKEVQVAVAQYLLHGLKDRLPGLVTVSHVKMPADLRAAKVFISVLGTDQEKDMVMEILHNRARDVQNYLAENLRMRYCPKLSFYPDTTTESVLKVERILKELKDTNQLPGSEDEK
jgi:ribosome-binding factor A